MKVAIWIPVILMAITIFGFSKQDGTESQGLSDKVASVVVDVADRWGIISVNEENHAVYVARLQTPIRKGAHMSEYAVFGILVFFALSVDGFVYRFRYLMTLGLTFLFACSDEIHQLYVPGRSGQFRDVLIDTCGCLLAMAVIGLILRKIYKKTYKNI